MESALIETTRPNQGQISRPEHSTNKWNISDRLSLMGDLIVLLQALGIAATILFPSNKYIVLGISLTGIIGVLYLARNRIRLNDQNEWIILRLSMMILALISGLLFSIRGYSL